MRKTPNRVSSIGAFKLAERPRPSTRRVSAGSMMPSSQRRAVASWLRWTELDSVDLVVLDPPRSGAGAEVLGRVLDLAPRAVAYVACDPAALARDVATFVASGYALAGLRCFDAFPMTHHLECIALLAPIA